MIKKLVYNFVLKTFHKTDYISRAIKIISMLEKQTYSLYFKLSIKSKCEFLLKKTLESQKINENNGMFIYNLVRKKKLTI